jgi:hypothetical protein
VRRPPAGTGSDCRRIRRKTLKIYEKNKNGNILADMPHPDGGAGVKMPEKEAGRTINCQFFQSMLERRRVLSKALPALLLRDCRRNIKSNRLV